MTVKTEYLTVWVSDDIKDEPETAAFLDMIARKTEENSKNVPIFSNKEVEDSNKQNKNPKTYDAAIFVNKSRKDTVYGNIQLKSEPPVSKDESVFANEPVREPVTNTNEADDGIPW